MPASVSYETDIRKFGQKGEKTGWTYIQVPEDLALELMPGNRKSFRVKGKLDAMKISSVALIPMGDGSFILPLNQDMRKLLGKRKGAMLKVQLSVDNAPFKFSKDLLECLDDDPEAKDYFQTLPMSHQKYFSKWIDGAKTAETRVKRISDAVSFLHRKMGFAEMLRNRKKGTE